LPAYWLSSCFSDRQQEQIVMSADNRLLVLTPQEIGRDILETYQYPGLSRIGAIDYDKKTGNFHNP
jgi:hypothetical protein